MPKILAGEKVSTIRFPKDCNRFKPGQILDAVCGPRYKPVAFARLEVIEVNAVGLKYNYDDPAMGLTNVYFFINARLVEETDLEILAEAEGFEDEVEMRNWFINAAIAIERDGRQIKFRLLPQE